MEDFELMYGPLAGVLRYDSYLNGQAKDLELREENELITDYGTFIPQHSEAGAIYERHKKYRSSMTLHDNGHIKSIALERQSIVKTPLGEYPAELVTFYNDGALNRVFPLNGQINGYWSEDDEGKLAMDYPFNFPFGSFTTKIISLRFYPGGQLKSLTLWPGSIINIQTPIGPMDIRHGFALYENGQLKSVEPAKPKIIHTKIGAFLTYDHDALGIHADTNSLTFSPKGEIQSFITSTNGVEVTLKEDQIIRVGPREAPSYIDISETMIVPIEVMFKGTDVIIKGGMKHIFDYESSTFKVYVSKYAQRGGCTDCSSCSSCG